MASTWRYFHCGQLSSRSRLSIPSFERRFAPLALIFPRLPTRQWDHVPLTNGEADTWGDTWPCVSGQGSEPAYGCTFLFVVQSRKSFLLSFKCTESAKVNGGSIPMPRAPSSRLASDYFKYHSRRRLVLLFNASHSIQAWAESGSSCLLGVTFLQDRTCICPTALSLHFQHTSFLE